MTHRDMEKTEKKIEEMEKAEEEIVLWVHRLSEKAKLPTRATSGSAGYDLSASEDMIIAPKSREMIKTDLVIAVPPGYYGRIAPRSGLAKKNGIDVGAGVVDSDYRGPLCIILFNHDSTNCFEIKTGDRIAQLLLEKICIPPVFECASLLDLSQTVRGSDGFGSTGVS